MGEIGAGLWSEFLLCGRIWGGFGGVSLCCVWDNFVCDWGSECVLCLGQLGAGLGGVSLCCLWESLGRFWVSEFVLCVGEIGVCLGE